MERDFSPEKWMVLPIFTAGLASLVYGALAFTFLGIFASAT